MEWKQRINSKALRLSAAFFLPVLCMLAVCLANEVTPFGDNTLLISDCDHQYSAYLTYFKTIFTGESDFFYTFSKSLGGDMVSFSGYYLLSPLNLLLFLFPNAQMPLAITVLILTKIGLCGLTMQLLAEGEFDLGVGGLPLSTAYALCGYVTLFFWNVMWMDALILLPLILWGIHRLERGRPLLYVLSLASAVVICYYTGYMLCLFSALYAGYRLIARRPACGYGRFVLRYVGGSAGAVGLSAFALIPIALSMRDGKAVFSLSILTADKKFPLEQLPVGLFDGTIEWQQAWNAAHPPVLFSGALVLLLAVLFFTQKAIPWREKLAAGGVLGILTLSFWINGLDLIWHGFNYPTAFPYRYFFLFCGFLVVLACRSFGMLREQTPSLSLPITGGVLVLITVLLLWKGETVNTWALCITGGVLVFSVLFLFCHKELGRLLPLVLVGMQMVQLGYNTNSAVSTLIRDSGPITASAYAEQYEQTGSLVRQLEGYSTDFYRLEKTYLYPPAVSNNDAMRFNYNGLTHFSSCDKTFIKTFLQRMGFRNNGNWAFYKNGSTASVDALLGIRYLLTMDDDGTHKPYPALINGDEVTAYYNQNALPLGFASTAAITEVSAQTGDVFSLQNAIWSAISGAELSLFTPISAEEQATGVTVYTEGENTRYAPSGGERPSIKYFLTITEEKPVYAYWTGPYCRDVQLYVNGKYEGNYFNIWRWDAAYLGTFSPGEQVLVELRLREEVVITDAYFCYEDTALLAETCAAINAAPTRWENTSDSRLTGTVTVPEGKDCLLITVPLEEGWRATVDGKPVRLQSALEALTVIEISPGEHTVTLTYTPPGLAAGWGITLAAAALILVWWYVLKKKQPPGTNTDG